MNATQIKSCKDRFEDLLRQCDHDLRKMFIECQHLKDEEHNEAEYYNKKYERDLTIDKNENYFFIRFFLLLLAQRINQLQNRSLELKSHILNEIDTSKSKRLSNINQNGDDSVNSSFANFINWIENKKVISIVYYIVIIPLRYFF